MKHIHNSLKIIPKIIGSGRILKIFILGLISCQPACTKFVEVDPPTTQLVSQNVFTSDATAVSTVVGTYSKMISSQGFASGWASSVTLLSGLSADELVNYSTDPNTAAFYKNSLTSANSVCGGFLWNECYNLIYTSNAILAGLSGSTGISDSTRKELEGEVRFLRAFCNFYLVNLFGSVPLINTTDYRRNSIANRTPVSIVYDSIVADLKNAKALLPLDYSYSNGERIRPNRWAATAMLARVYLYLQDWTDAEEESSSVISNADLFALVPDLNSVFLKNSPEAIWQLMPVIPERNTNEGYMFILTDYPQTASLSQSLIDSFEVGDNRRIDWVDSVIVSSQTFYYPFKYKIQTGSDPEEYSMVLRLAEQYLIRAEARAHLNDIAGSISDLNAIRFRAGLAGTTANDQTGLLSAIQHERQIELNTEWGHRWLDLKRTGEADQVLGSVKGAGWQSTDTLYPIPKTDITADPNLTQNPGY
jgi:starch-binding outer membrane protein, SusD/RagB family